MFIPLLLRGAACLARCVSGPREPLQNAWGERVVPRELCTPLGDTLSSAKGDAESGY